MKLTAHSARERGGERARARDRDRDRDRDRNKDREVEDSKDSLLTLPRVVEKRAATRCCEATITARPIAKSKSFSSSSSSLSLFLSFSLSLSISLYLSLAPSLSAQVQELRRSALTPAAVKQLSPQDLSFVTDLDEDNESVLSYSLYLVY
jgi:hypothetical protein